MFSILELKYKWNSMISLNVRNFDGTPSRKKSYLTALKD